MMGTRAANPQIPLGQRSVKALYRNRRRVATGLAIMLAAVMGYCAVAGDNGLQVYKEKRNEDKRLAEQIERLKQENSQLQGHVARLKDDPDAIEHEAREKLHYTRPGEMIYTLPDPPASGRPTAH